jgi:hypothetical protein
MEVNMRKASHSKKGYHLAGASIFLLIVALIAGAAGCSGMYSLTMAVVPGAGGTATDLTGASPYEAGTVVTVKAEASEGYVFDQWEATAGTFADANSSETTFTMPAHSAIVTAIFVSPLITTWYDLNAVRNNLAGSYILMNDLDSTTAGYEKLASSTANQGKGWQPIGTDDVPFTGAFDGQRYEICDLVINRPGEYHVGLFSIIGPGGIIQDAGLVNCTVTGNWYVGILAGYNSGTISNSCSSGGVTGGSYVGSLVGYNELGMLDNCHAAGSVTGDVEAAVMGGLVGMNEQGTVIHCYATSSVAGGWQYGDCIGGLVGDNEYGILSDCHATGSATGDSSVGGLVGHNQADGTVTNCYATGSVISGGQASSIGGLVGSNFGTVSDCYAMGDVTGGWVEGEAIGGLVGDNNYLGTISNSYYNYDTGLINGEKIITIGALFDEDFDEWLANGKFLDVNERLSEEDGYYVVNDVTDFKQLLAFGQDDGLKFSLANDLDLATEPDFYIPYLAGDFDAGNHTVFNLNVGFDFLSHVGLFGYLADGASITSLGVESASIDGADYVGGVIGLSKGTVSNCHAGGSVTGKLYIGGLAGDNYHGTVSNSSSTANVISSGPYGDGSCAGSLLGGNDEGAVSDCYSTGSVTGEDNVGGLVGWNIAGTVSNSHSTGSMTGDYHVGGLIGTNGYSGTVSNSYSTGSVYGSMYSVGGLIGDNGGAVSNSYSTGSVTGDTDVGGLVGSNTGFVTDSFWDVETSGQPTSDGGTGKTTAEMQDISTFSGVAWDIVGVADSGARNIAYIWNIVDGVTYPFLSWQSI